MTRSITSSTPGGPALSRGALACSLGLITALGCSLIMLAGSDLPPPRGFLIVVALAMVAGLAVGFLVPPLLRVRDRRGAAVALVGVAVISVLAAAIGAGVILASGPGEPTIGGISAGEAVIFGAVVTVVFLFGALTMGGVAMLVDCAPTRRRAYLLLGVLVGVLVALPLLIIGVRLG